MVQKITIYIEAGYTVNTIVLINLPIIIFCLIYYDSILNIIIAWVKVNTIFENKLLFYQMEITNFVWNRDKK
jgi:hypothetical protein